ncbi:MAG TPA: hypothetical protein VFQ44_22110 [Streptosporangiaceae bacterium]|nr:hypothetical protein [Streptosporangiaceae bacterium]
MGLTSDDLVAALTVCLGEESTGLADTLDMMRRDPVTPTILSAWLQEGRELNPALRFELDTEVARIEYYRRLDARLTSKIPGLSSVKGLEILELYPAGLTRHQNDLDYVASEADLWQACDQLISDGWELDTATFLYFDDSIQVMASMRLENDDPYGIPYGVELSTFYSMGNYGAIRPLARMPEKWRSPAIKNIIMLLYERYEQPFRARDLYDAVLLHEALTDGELSILHRAVVKLSLGVEYSELHQLVAEAGLGPLPAWPARRLAASVIRARRLALGASHFLRPVAGTGRQMQRRMITGELGKREARAWELVQRHLSVPQGLSAGLLAFGLPMEGPRPKVTSTVLYRHKDLAWADTPVARLLLTIGDYVTEDKFDQLTERIAARADDGAASATEPA